MWSVPAPSPALPSPWTLIDLLSNSDNCCLTRKCRRASSNQADFSRGQEQQGEENWQEGELGGGNIKEGNNISVRGNKRGEGRTGGLLLLASYLWIMDD